MKAKTINMCAKCSDMFGASVLDKDGKELFDYDGYVPGFFPGEHYGDYVILEIELATGKILNWKAPTEKQLKQMQVDQ